MLQTMRCLSRYYGHEVAAYLLKRACHGRMVDASDLMLGFAFH